MVYLREDPKTEDLKQENKCKKCKFGAHEDYDLRYKDITCSDCKFEAHKTYDLKKHDPNHLTKNFSKNCEFGVHKDYDLKRHKDA